MFRESLKLDPGELVAEVERIDTRYSERITVVAYSDGTRVLHRGREYPVDHLKPGDVVAMFVKETTRGRYESDFLSIRDRRENRDTAP